MLNKNNLNYVANPLINPRIAGHNAELNHAEVINHDQGGNDENHVGIAHDPVNNLNFEDCDQHEPPASPPR